MGWSYKREARQFPVLPEGDYRIRVRSVEKVKSKKSNRDMLAFQFDVSGRNEILFHHIVFMEDRPEMTNRMLTQFFDSFKDIPEGDFNLANWVGKVGACKVKHEESDYNGGSIQARIHFFISADKAANLPPWSEPAGTKEKKPDWTDNKAAADDFMPVPEGVGSFDEIPLF
jgi:hypothetical protein